MTPEEIRSRLRTGEDSRTELKSLSGGFPSLEVIAKSVSALANTGGGDVFFGVEDDALECTGVGSAKDAERLQHHVSQACNDAIEPPLRVRQTVVELDGQLVLIASVPGYLPGRPFRGRSKYYVRDGPVSREARPDELKTLLTSGANVHYDEQPIDGSTRADLDDVHVRDLLAKLRRAGARGDDETYLRSLKLLARDGTPTVAGVLMLASDPRRFIVDAYVSGVRFRGTAISHDMIEKQDLGGALVDQLEAGIAFIARHVSTTSEIAGTRRVDRAVPVEVWREALTNALSHRDYSVTSQTRIYVFDDRVEIANPGVLLNQLTLDSVRMGGVSQRRNPYLAAALARLGYAESVGMGVPALMTKVRDAGFAEPEIVLGSGEFRLIVRTLPLGSE